MPLYVYRCDACEVELEELDRVGAPVPDCGTCGGPRRRLVGASSLRPDGITPEVDPEPGKPSPKPKRPGHEVVDRVANRIVTESRKPGNRPMDHAEARTIALRTRLRRERRRNR